MMEKSDSPLMKRMKEGAYIAQRRMNGRCGAALAMSST